MKHLILLLSFMACAAQEATTVPANAQIVTQLTNPPETTPIFKPRPIQPRPIGSIPPNRKQPVISKADVVMAATDRIGILVNNLAQNLAMDLRDLLNNLPMTPTQRGTRVMEEKDYEGMDEWAEP